MSNYIATGTNRAHKYKEIQLSGPIQSKSDQPADQKVNGAISENQPIKKSDEDPDQGSMIGEKDWGSSHSESSVSQSIIEKEISDKIDTLQIDSTVASADEIPNACENIHVHYCKYIHIYIYIHIKTYIYIYTY